MELRVAGRSFVEVPYGGIDKLTYDNSQQHHIKEGAAVMVASIGAGSRRGADSLQEPLADGRLP